MSKPFRWMGAWVFYWLGDLLSKPLHVGFAWLYPAYNWCMSTSVMLDGDDCWVWEPMESRPAPEEQ